MKAGTVAAIAGGVVVVVVLAVALSHSGQARDISGTYEVYVGDRDTKASLVITSQGSNYLFSMTGNNGLKASFVAPKERTNHYVLTSTADGMMDARYSIAPTKNGLRGTIDLLPIGTVDVLFKKAR